MLAAALTGPDTSSCPKIVCFARFARFYRCCLALTSVCKLTGGFNYSNTPQPQPCDTSTLNTPHRSTTSLCRALSSLVRLTFNDSLHWPPRAATLVLPLLLRRICYFTRSSAKPPPSPSARHKTPQAIASTYSLSGSSVIVTRTVMR